MLRPERNRQHNDREEERAKKVESQVKRPRGHMDPKMVRSLFKGKNRYNIRSLFCNLLFFVVVLWEFD